MDLTDFTGFDFDKWKTDPDRVRRPQTFSIEQSLWDPRPISLRIEHSEFQSTSIDVTPAELVDLSDKLAAFVEEHRLRDHV